MKIQSLNIRCQFMIKNILIITCNERAIVLSINKYETIEQKHRKIFVPIANLFLITEMVKLVKPNARKV